MTVLAEHVDRFTLDPVLHATGPVASVYLGTPPEAANEYQLEWATRWRPVAETLHTEGADAATVAAAEQAVVELAAKRAVHASRAVAAFVENGRVLGAYPAPGARWPDGGRYVAPAHLVPLLAWAQDRPPYVLVVIDRVGADVEVSAGAGAAAAMSGVKGPDDEIERNAPGGWEGLTQGRYQRRAEDSWKHNAGAVAAHALAALEQVGARVLVVSGDVRAVQLFKDSLPERVHRTVAVEQIKGSRHVDGSERTRAEQVAELVRAHARRELDALWERFGEQRGPGGLAVEGAAATLNALAEGRVGTLLVRASAEDGRRAWYGARPTEVHLAAQVPTEPHPETWTEAHRGPMVDVAVRTALLTGADVRIVPEDAADGLLEGIGALCRFR